MYSGQQGLYASGARFGLGDMSAQQWAQFFQAVQPGATQLIATVTGQPIAPQPAAVVASPFGAIPAWLLPVGLIGLVALAATGSRRNPPRRRSARRSRRRR